MNKNLHINRRFVQLLERFQAGKCSLTELYELEAFFEQAGNVSAVKDQMFWELEHAAYPVGKPLAREQLFRKLKQQIALRRRKENTRVLPLFQFIRIAAAIILSFILGGTLTYFISQHPSKEKPVSWCEVVAPLGAKSQVILPDSSVVWLNAGSKLRYSTSFNVSDRKLNLEGEGYFFVAKNRQLPLVVDAWGFLVQAVGTEFDVKAYREEPTIETILVKGKVKLDHATEPISDQVFLDPGYKATFYKKGSSSGDQYDSRLVISPESDLWSLISWKEGLLIFKKESLKDLAVKLRRKYNYTFQFMSESARDYRFTGTLEDETLQQVLDVISLTSPVSYEIKGKTVIINMDENRIQNFKKQ